VGEPAFDEQLELGIASVTCVEKFVQPLNWRYDMGTGENTVSY